MCQVEDVEMGLSIEQLNCTLDAALRERDEVEREVRDCEAALDQARRRYAASEVEIMRLREMIVEASHKVVVAFEE